MSRMTWWTALVAVIALPAASSCGDAVTTSAVPVPGALVVSIEATRGTVGAVLLIVQGEGIGTPTAIEPAQQVQVRSLDASTYRVAVIGERVAGRDLFSFDVPDVTRPEAYSVTLLQVADESNELQVGLDGYRLVVQRARLAAHVE